MFLLIIPSTGNGVTFSPSYNILVDDIPEELLEYGENSSAHASKIFSGTNKQTIATWFTATLVHPVLWELEHPLTMSGSNHFEDYISLFPSKGLKVWDIQNSKEAINRLYIHTRDKKAITIAGRGDYLITEDSETKASYLNRMLCVVEVESQKRSKDYVEEECILQILTYMLILMNTKGLTKLVGFLVLKSGQCRAFRATRDVAGACMYEQNDLFHVSHIADICERLVNDF